jgi:predicted RNA-binding protein with PIN domain
MRYVLDACNLIFQDRELEEALDEHGFPAVRELLVRRLARYAHAERLQEITAVFDGSEKAAHRPREERCAGEKVLLIYATPREKADLAIIELVENCPRPGELTVVTNDRFIIRQVRGAGAHQISCREFLRRMRASIRRAADPLRGEDPRKFQGLSPREVEEWAKEFGVTEEGDLK